MLVEISIDVTLAKLCSYFNSHTYQRLLNAYRLLGKSLTSMDQLQMHFVNVVQTHTLEILLKTVATINNEQNLSSYSDLCKEFRFFCETSSISFNQKSDFDLFDRYLYTEHEHPFDLDQTRTTFFSSWLQYKSDSENEQKRSSMYGNRSHYHDDKNESTIVTNTTLNVIRLFGRYMKMIEMLKPIAFDVIICMTQFFDYYLYTVYPLFALSSKYFTIDYI
ncbi:unnamed protein product [Adineta steineri]|uniref:Vacuolar protein sorting-associated protein 54 N-terminal domain-containing protein n=1 Tax=Adineta steineri TaxID=433720 RepID=A0A813UE69_9BILA|nr:unnamed protein product [Adineta steineri]CAF1236691.1 unnamed protein product [Adineta steineri]